jgi:hypothetical protein
MRAFSLAVLMLLVGVGSSDARHRHHRSYGFSHHHRVGPEAADFGDRSGVRRGASEFVPRDWQLQPPDAAWKGKRFVSPDRQAWVAAYSSSAQRESVAAHMRTVAFEKDTDVVTYLRAERDWIAVSGVSGDRAFYRKAVLACSGTAWHHVAYEYPVAQLRELDRFVAMAAAAIDRTRNQGCDEASPSADTKSQPETSGARD